MSSNLTVTINGGAGWTTSRDVTLTLAQTTSYISVQMRIKNAGGSFTSWEAFATSYSWTLTSGFGQKTVTVELRGRNAASEAWTTITASASIEYTEEPELTDNGSWLVLKTPDYDPNSAGEQTSYLRLGAANATVENSLLDSHGGIDAAKLRKRGADNASRDVVYNGWFEYTDNDRVQVTRGHHRVAIGGDKYETIEGTYELTINGGTLSTYDADPIYGLHFYKQDGLLTGGKTAYRKREWGHTANVCYDSGDTETFYFGFTFDLKTALAIDVFMGVKIAAEAAIGLEASLGYSLKVGAAINYENTNGQDIQVADEIEHKARKSVHMRVKTTPEKLADAVAKKHTGLLIGSGLALGGSVVALALAGGLTAVKFSDDADTTTGVNVGVLGGLGSLTFSALLGLSVALALKAKGLRSGPSRSEVKLTDEGVKIARNLDVGTMQSQILVGEETGSAQNIKLENAAGCWAKLFDDGDIALNAANDIYLQNGGPARIKVKGDGTIYVKSTQNNFSGTLNVNNGALEVQ